MDEKLIFDVGLHMGEDTDFYLKKGYNVVGFEANPDLVVSCSSRFRTEIEQGRLRIIEGAITSDPEGTPIIFYKNQGKSVFGTISPDWAKRNEKQGDESIPIAVKRVDLAEAFQRYGTPYYIKIDIEGADLCVLQSLSKLPDRPRYVSIESDKEDFASLTRELQLFLGLGYRKFKAVQQKTIPDSRVVTRNLLGQEVTYTFQEHASGPFGDDLRQPWLTYEECIEEYKRIFKMYRLFGDKSLPRRIKGGGRLIDTFAKLLHTSPLPGWYDTHAALP